MKYLKISSLLVLSLLLFVPAAVADVTCELRPNSKRLRMESMHEPLATLTVRCEADAGTLDSTTDGQGGLDLVNTRSGDGKGESTFDLELQFSGEISNGDGDDVTLWLMDTDEVERDAGFYTDATGGTEAADDSTTATDVQLTATDAKGNRIPAPVGIVGRDSVYWEGIPFPKDWAGDTRGTFSIAGIYIDASSIDGERLDVTVDMIGNDLTTDATGDTQTLDAEVGPVSVGRVDQALSMMFDEDVDDNKANDKINACVPGKFKRTFLFEEGFRDAWDNGNDILLTVSSGSIKAEDKAPFDVTAEGGAGELIIDVTPDDDATESVSLAIEFAPAAGNVGDDLILTAELLPVNMRGTTEMFMMSASVDVGTYAACTGDSLTFPFISNSSGFDTGIVLANNSKVDGSCNLFWNNVKLMNDDDEVVVDERDVIEVEAKKQSVFILSMQKPDFQGLLSVECTFGSAHGYAFITDTVNASGAQGYLAVK